MTDEAECIMFRFSGGRGYVAQARDLEIVALQPEVVTSAEAIPALSLDRVLQETKTQQTGTCEHWLRIVGTGARAPRWLCTRASLDVVSLPVSSFFRLPEIIRVCANAPWMRGMVLLDHSIPTEAKRIALWIELAAIPT